MARVVVIGAGAMGLAAGYRAAKEGHAVDVIEATLVDCRWSGFIISRVCRICLRLR
jgi:glycine/D-amino acid oxidase-like deaminating enzyme